MNERIRNGPMRMGTLFAKRGVMLFSSLSLAISLTSCTSTDVKQNVATDESNTVASSPATETRGSTAANVYTVKELGALCGSWQYSDVCERAMGILHRGEYPKIDQDKMEEATTAYFISRGAKVEKLETMGGDISYAHVRVLFGTGAKLQSASDTPVLASIKGPGRMDRREASDPGDAPHRSTKSTL